MNTQYILIAIGGYLIRWFQVDITNMLKRKKRLNNPIEPQNDIRWFHS